MEGIMQVKVYTDQTIVLPQTWEYATWKEKMFGDVIWLREGKLIIYVSAPYSKGDTVENVRNACLAGNAILAKGHIPFVPHLTHLWHFITPKSYEQWLEIDLALIPRMDALLRLPGESTGADREVELAKSLGIPVYYSLEEIPQSVIRL